MPRKPANRRPRRRVPKGVMRSAIKTEIKRVLNKNAETKQVVYYSNSSGLAGDGTYANRSYMGQNQFISNTITDLKRLIPFVKQGTGDNQRIGDDIRPLSLVTHVALKVSLADTTGNLPVDIFAVCYFLEHKIYNQYTSLIPGTTTSGSLPTGNDFTQLLMNGEDKTVSFRGDVMSAHLPVSGQYYRLIKKKVIRLRFAGINTSGVSPPASFVGVPNSHDYTAHFTVRTKLPKTLKYPEQLNAAGSPAIGINDPTNSAPFWCVGFYQADGTATNTPIVLLEQYYTSILKYKDM